MHKIDWQGGAEGGAHLAHHGWRGCLQHADNAGAVRVEHLLKVLQGLFNERRRRLHACRCRSLHRHVHRR